MTKPNANNMRKIIYHAVNGHAVADGLAEQFALALNDNGVDAIVSTENVIYATRALIHDGVIDHKSVCFVFDDLEIHADADGRIAKWPTGFCRFVDDWLMRLVSRSTKTKDVIE